MTTIITTKSASRVVINSPIVDSEVTVSNGPKGDPGATGPAGAPGSNGIGVPTGGTTGQVLTKNSATDYDTSWQTVSGGGGVSDGDKGDITVSGSGATWTIDAGAVSLSKMADLATSTILGRATAGTGVPEALTAAQVRTILNVADGATANAADSFLLNRANHTGTQAVGTITGLSALATSTDAANLTGTLAAARLPALTGAVTSSAGSAATALGSFTRAQLDAAVSDGNVLYVGDVTTNATHTGDATGATALTLATVNSNVGAFGSATQVATFTVNGKGLTTAAGNTSIAIPASQVTDFNSATRAQVEAELIAGTNVTITPAGSGATRTLTIAASGGGGGGSPGGSSGEVQFNNAGSFAGAADVEIEGGQLRLPAIATPTAPSAGGAKLFGRSVSNRILPAFVGPAGLDSSLQPFFGRNKIGLFMPAGNGGADAQNGLAVTALGTATSEVVATTNLHNYMRRRSWRVTVAATTAVAGLRGAATQFTIGGPSAGLGGFHLVWRWGPATGVSNASHRAFVGMRNSTTNPTDVNPSTALNIVGMGYDAADTQVQIMHNDGTGAATKIPLGASFPKPSVDLTEVYELALFTPPGTTQAVHYEVTNLVTGAVATGTINTDIPTTTTLLAPYSWMSVGGVSAVIGFATMGIYIETDY